MWKLRADMMSKLAAVAIALSLFRPESVAFGQDAPNPDEEGGPDVLRIYDFRDLAEILPNQTGAVTNPLSDGPFAESGSPSPLTELVDALCGSLSLENSELMPGIFTIQGDREQLEQLKSVLDQIRRLYEGSYEIDLAMHSVAIAEAPSVGSEFRGQETVLRHRACAIRRSPLPIVCVTDKSYLSALVPSVAESAFAYGTQVLNVEDGVSGWLTVGAGSEDSEHTLLHFRGEIRSSKMGRFTGPDAQGGWRVELPEEQRRVVDTRLQVKLSKPTVVAVVTGFENSQALVVTVAVTKVGAPDEQTAAPSWSGPPLVCRR